MRIEMGSASVRMVRTVGRIVYCSVPRGQP